MRHAQVLNGGRVETSLLGSHQGRAHKLAIEPGSPYIFYTCGEDGLVQRVSFDCSFCRYIMFHQHSKYYNLDVFQGQFCFIITELQCDTVHFTLLIV